MRGCLCIAFSFDNLRAPDPEPWAEEAITSDMHHDLSFSVLRHTSPDPGPCELSLRR
jgi:hypothetical protein